MFLAYVRAALLTMTLSGPLVPGRPSLHPPGLTLSNIDEATSLGSRIRRINLLSGKASTSTGAAEEPLGSFTIRLLSLLNWENRAAAASKTILLMEVSQTSWNGEPK